MKHFGKTIVIDGIKFPSQKEAVFYLRFIKPSGKKFKAHPRYTVADHVMVGGSYMKKEIYTPDFVVFDESGAIEHVYDVKTGISTRAVDGSARKRFRQFAGRYGMPVEVVVPRKHDFKMKLLGFENPRLQTRHVKRDRHGNIKHTAKGNPQYEYYDVHKNVNYDIHDTIGW
ncbi:DUF1064 domain-containing protein [Limosilactobacillus pontis]|uniref:DUF1064 domain-containing protein n=1 Tax=Limosilactobacillus pontis TaxID=35787 RepID=UPI0025A437F1|nr:DUF1064 domain-containing protein [Limosilactobacillus pontis]MDM8331544.1 DUF1064 domain-containing protein [Limosilactobacillus pontis]